MKKTALFVLDGIADRKIDSLGNRTPLEAATTPNLDELARNSALGLLLPRKDLLGASTDLTHFLMLGYPESEYPGRSVLEAAFLNIPVEFGNVYLSALIGSIYEKEGHPYLVREGIKFCEEEVVELFSDVQSYFCGFYQFTLYHDKGRYGILVVKGPFETGPVDTDPFKDLYPVNHPVSENLSYRDLHLSKALSSYLSWVRKKLASSQVNRHRERQGLPPLDIIVTKWPSFLKSKLQTFSELTGMKGAIVATQSFFKGLSNLISTHFEPLKGITSTEKVINAVKMAESLLYEKEFDFVLVNIKDADEASHLKKPEEKVKTIEELDKGFSCLLDSKILGSEDTVFCLTADHPSPSTGNLIHSGEFTPFLVHSSFIGKDETKRFNESEAAKGKIPVLYAEQVLPFLLNASDRIAYSGSRLRNERRIGFTLASEIRTFKDLKEI